MKKKSLFILLLLFIPGLLFLNYIGVFIRVKVMERAMGPYCLVYKNHLGEYKYTGQTIAEVKTLLAKKGIGTGNSFGIFYDDPKQTKKENLRAKAGLILQAPYTDTAGSGLHCMEFPQRNCILAEYPNRNFLSVYSGLAKVHPKLFKYAAELGYQKGPVMEIYEADKIIYLMVVEK